MARRGEHASGAGPTRGEERRGSRHGAAVPCPRRRGWASIAGVALAVTSCGGGASAPAPGARTTSDAAGAAQERREPRASPAPRRARSPEEAAAAAVLLGVLARGAGAQVEVEGASGEGWIASVELAPREALVVQPLPGGASLFTGLHQVGAAIYVAADADDALRAWCAEVARWQDDDVEAIVDSVGSDPARGPTRAAPAPPAPRRVRGLLVPLAEAATLGFPLQDAAVRAALTADGAAGGETGEREGWVLLVGPRWPRR